MVGNNLNIQTHSFEFAKYVSDDQHPSSIENINEPLVRVTSRLSCIVK